MIIVLAALLIAAIIAAFVWRSISAIASVQMIVEMELGGLNENHGTLHQS